MDRKTMECAMTKRDLKEEMMDCYQFGTIPRFMTKISLDGPEGNIFCVIGAVRSLARQLGLPDDEIKTFTKRITESESYKDAIKIVNEWFFTTGGGYE